MLTIRYWFKTSDVGYLWSLHLFKMWNRFCRMPKLKVRREFFFLSFSPTLGVYYVPHDIVCAFYIFSHFPIKGRKGCGIMFEWYLMVFFFPVFKLLVNVFYCIALKTSLSTGFGRCFLFYLWLEYAHQRFFMHLSTAFYFHEVNRNV